MNVPVPPIWVMDTECYRDYFLVAFRNVYSGQSMAFDMWPGKPLDMVFPFGTIITFNGINYDFPILSLAMSGCDSQTLKAATDGIILNGMKPWHISDAYGGIDLSHIDHIDLIEVAPGKSSLKIYGGRLHSNRLQDLPIEPDASISESDRDVLREYCLNDLDTTIDLYQQLKPQLDLRQAMSVEFGMDLRSKSDAQIAEAVIKSEVQKLLGRKIFRQELHPSYKFNYTPPSFVAFQTPGMQKAMDIIRGVEFSLGSEGQVVMPKTLESMRLRIGNGVYRMGIGGLHSSEQSVSHRADERMGLFDRDVTSYYPSIIITQGLYPPNMGPAFLEVYRSLVERRIKAKKEGNKVLADALKICVNGSFGKLGSKWSILYSPELLIQVTLTGQLALLMLIEAVELSDLQVISANTDGVVIKCPRNRKEELDSIVTAWEITSGFNTEETEYSALYSKDVNNYIAIKPDNSTKLKGLYAPAGMQKNTTNEVAVEAVIERLVKDYPITETVNQCKDIRKFLTIRKVTGGAVYGEKYLGKAVRWYYAANETRHIQYSANGNKVARSEGARPLMQLPITLPEDIDYDWYIREAESIMCDVGA